MQSLQCPAFWQENVCGNACKAFSALPFDKRLCAGMHAKPSVPCLLTRDCVRECMQSLQCPAFWQETVCGNACKAFSALPFDKRLCAGMHAKPSVPCLLTRDCVRECMQSLQCPAFWQETVCGNACKAFSALPLTRDCVRECMQSLQCPAFWQETVCGNACKAFSALPFDKRLCVVSQLREYLRRTVLEQGINSSFLLWNRTTQSPENVVEVVQNRVSYTAGADLTECSVHGTRTVSASAAFSCFTILTAAEWSRQKTFG